MSACVERARGTAIGGGEGRRQRGEGSHMGFLWGLRVKLYTVTAVSKRM
jgi:hypothetical protein